MIALAAIKPMATVSRVAESRTRADHSRECATDGSSMCGPSYSRPAGPALVPSARLRPSHVQPVVRGVPAPVVRLRSLGPRPLTPRLAASRVAASHRRSNTGIRRSLRALS
jgi:hypothetical protein